MKIDYTHYTRHQSSREGGRIHGLVLHTTQGSDNPRGNPPADLVELGSIFDGEEASAHLGVNVAGKFARYVADSQKAWAVCNYNSLTLSLEQIAFAEYEKAEWFKDRHPQLHGAAEFLCYGHVHYGVPLHPGEVNNGAIIRPGIFQHSDLGIVGSGHVDCGPGYPQGYVTLLAKFFIAHRLHPKAPHTLRLHHEIERIRKHYGLKLEEPQMDATVAWDNIYESPGEDMDFRGLHHPLAQ